MQRPLFAAIPLLISATLLANPASAHDTRPAPDSAAELRHTADRFADPATQEDVSHVIEALTGVVLDLPVGEFAEAIERARPGTVDEDINRNTRLGDLAGPEAERIPARVGNGTRASMAAMGGMMRAFADMLPELQKLGRDLEASVERARDQQ